MSTIESSVLVNMLSQKVIDVGEVHISRTSLGKKKKGNRYLIYLPIGRNYLWKILHKENVKVRVFIEIPSEGLIRGEQGEGKQ
jgi:hypothetical protein